MNPVSNSPLSQETDPLLNTPKLTEVESRQKLLEEIKGLTIDMKASVNQLKEVAPTLYKTIEDGILRNLITRMQELARKNKRSIRGGGE